MDVKDNLQALIAQIEQAVHCGASEQLCEMTESLRSILRDRPALFDTVVARVDSLLENPTFVEALMGSDICLSKYSVKQSSQAWPTLQRVLAVRLDACISAAQRGDDEAFSREMKYIERYLDFLEPYDTTTIEALTSALWEILDLPDVATAIARECVNEVWLLLQGEHRPLEEPFKEHWCKAYRLTRPGGVEYPLLELLIDLFPNEDTVALLGRLAASRGDKQPILSAGGLAYACYLVLGSYPQLRQNLVAVLKELTGHSDEETARIAAAYMEKSQDDTENA